MLNGVSRFALSIALLALVSLAFASSSAAGTPIAEYSVPPPAATSPNTAAAPSRALVLEAQRLFRVLGYPLRGEQPGIYGVSTRGAVSYFQRKYGLPVSGELDTATLAAMRRAAGELRATVSQPKDLVQRTFGKHVPLFAIALAMALLLAGLALRDRFGRRGGAQDSATVEDSALLASAER